MSDQPIVGPLSFRNSISDDDLNLQTPTAIVSDVAQQLGSGQGQHYSIVLNGPLLQISALDGRPGLNSHGMIFYQYGDQTLSELRQEDLNRFAQVHHQLSSSQSTPQLDRD